MASGPRELPTCFRSRDPPFGSDDVAWVEPPRDEGLHAVRELPSSKVLEHLCRRPDFAAGLEAPATLDQTA
jgi:hypothetical protein